MALNRRCQANYKILQKMRAPLRGRRAVTQEGPAKLMPLVANPGRGERCLPPTLWCPAFPIICRPGRMGLPPLGFLSRRGRLGKGGSRGENQGGGGSGKSFALIELPWVGGGLSETRPSVGASGQKVIRIFHAIFGGALEKLRLRKRRRRGRGKCIPYCFEKAF